MLWLQPPPWGRWTAALLIAALAVWMELKPDPMVEHPFAVETIRPGESIDELNTEMRRVPDGMLQAAVGNVALREIPAGAPVLAADTGQPEAVVPQGWWIVATELPPQAETGDRVQIVMLDTGNLVAGVVVTGPSSDPFGTTTGGVAVEPAAAAEVAMAAAGGRIAVLLSTG